MLMIADKNKLDAPLKEIYANFLDTNSENVLEIKGSDCIDLMLLYSEKLEEIEQAGFETLWKEGTNLAKGKVNLKDLEKIAALPQVLRLEFGEEDDLFLDDSVVEIKARKGGADFVWDVSSAGIFSGLTGENVVIGIIDSGIDYRHPVFFKQSTPEIETRILRIWDPGLVPTSEENGPDDSLLKSSFTYGVEYSKGMIDDYLNKKSGAVAIRHRDCNGHGTHVASIAAGDGRAEVPSQSNSEYKYVGVAPKADLIIVKIFSLEHDPKKPDNNVVGFNDRFQDAVNYINEVVKQDYGDRPVVINYSGGSSLGPHDGLTPEEKWLTEYYEGKSKKVFVTSAGNAAGSSQHALLNLTANNPVEIPFNLYERRGGNRRDFKKCRYEDNTRTLFIECWYPEMSSGLLEAQFKLPIESNFRPASALKLNEDDVSGSFDGSKSFVFAHDSVDSIRPPSTNITRNVVRLTIKPQGNIHLSGEYILKLKATDAVPVHIWCFQAYGHGFKMGDVLPSEVVSGAHDKTLISAPAGAGNIIAVAAYDDSNGNITSFSSRGPLADYTSSGPYLDKPDLGAPGKSIRAAKSGYTAPLSPCCAPAFQADYTRKSGTSMSSPHVAGMAALLFEKDSNLSVAEIIGFIKSEARTVTPDVPEELGEGKADAYESVDAITP